MSKKTYDWAVVGAGPAGIAAVGKLLDHGVLPEKLLWVDPNFKVGDFGQKWGDVPSNTAVSLFLRFLHEVSSFRFIEGKHQFQLTTLDPEQTCQLKLMAEPLAWVTQQLRDRVCSIEGMLNVLSCKNGCWQLDVGDQQYASKHVILATGAVPRELAYPAVQSIDLMTAMAPSRLKEACAPDACVAVFGSSHSAILAIRNLIDLGVKHVINFYRSPLRYALPMDGWTLYDNTGLKGSTAQWAHTHMDSDQLPNLERYYSNDANIAEQLPRCQKAIYATGLERRHSFTLKQCTMTYDRHTGILAPGLFGVGIAFPEAAATPFGAVEHRVGLWKFMDYLNRVIPLWMRYHV